jgi:membrane protease subunit HflK
MDFQTPEDLLGLRRRFPFRPGLVGLFIAGFAALVTLTTLFYTIGPDEEGVVLFLGKYVRKAGPGLHTKIPWGVERVIPVKVERIFKEEFGFRTTKAGVRTQYSAQQFLDESLMLTGDLNALVVTWIVQFRVHDPAKLLFNLRNPVTTIRDISEAVMRHLVGDYSVDEVLTTKRAEIDAEARQKIQEILDSYDSGVRIVTVELQDVTAPDKVQPAFNEVNQAEQEKERVVNEALQYYNRIIPQARGQAERTVLEAEAYAVDRVFRAKGDAARFTALLEEYRKAPDVTRRRFYLEAMERILLKPREKFIVDPSQGALPLLDFRKGEKAS